MRVLILFAALACLISFAHAGDLFVDAGSSGNKIFSTATAGKKLSPGLADIGKLDGKSDVVVEEVVSPTVKNNVGTVAKTADMRRAVFEKEINYVITNLVADTRLIVQATAGMRIVTKAINDAAYSGDKDSKGICGMKVDKLKIDAAGPTCGTIPGTIEAMFEWLAVFKDFAGKGATRGDFGIISSGGASAQFAFPLTESEFDEWKRFRNGDLVTAIGDFKLGDFPPIFNKIPKTDEDRSLGDNNWLNDFVSWVPRNELPDDVQTEWAKNEGGKMNKDKPRYVALATVSFLAISDSTARGKLGNMFKAGGVVEMSKIVKSGACNTDPVDYKVCRHTMVETFHTDPIFKAVAGYFLKKKFAFDFVAVTGAVKPDLSNSDDTRTLAGAEIKGPDDKLNPKVCFDANQNGDLRPCVDAAAKWLADRCMGTKKGDPFKGDFALHCKTAFFLDAYYFPFFAKHTVEWPTTDKDPGNEFAAGKSLSSLSVSTGAPTSAPAGDSDLTNKIIFNKQDWNIGSLYYFEKNARTTLLSGPKGGFLETKSNLKLRNILVDNKH